MPRRKQPKYQYRCSFPGCDVGFGADIGPSEYPAHDGKHYKLMDFIEADSLEVPRHIQESKQKPVTGREDDKYKVNGGNWIGA